jgi:L-glyceraldehyde 3-phosphate reductase
MSDTYLARTDRYDTMPYRRCGRSGLKLPAISLGLWQNFGGLDVFETGRAIVRRAFDRGVTHFDLANNYGPPPGAAEENFGRMLAADLRRHRDEMIISSKAGFEMWPGPYGEWGSRKSLLASLDASLKRLGLDYVDIYYHHRPDPDTPIEESMGALADAVRMGKALYVGISNYRAAGAAKAIEALKRLGVPCLIHQPNYSMLDRWIEEDGLLDTLEAAGTGCIAFSPLQQGILTNKYLAGIPQESRAARGSRGGSMGRDGVTEARMAAVQRLAPIAERLGLLLASRPEMGAARCARHLGADRRAHGRATRQQSRCAGRRRPRGRRSGGDRKRFAGGLSGIWGR